VTRHTRLRDRRPECEALDQLLDRVRAGKSQVLVVRGEAGAGKTALLGYAVESALGFREARATGVRSEVELAFAGLQQLFSRLRRWPRQDGAGSSIARAESTMSLIACSDLSDRPAARSAMSRTWSSCNATATSAGTEPRSTSDLGKKYVGDTHQA
jgi:hypothetical protein